MASSSIITSESLLLRNPNLTATTSHPHKQALLFITRKPSSSSSPRSLHLQLNPLLQAPKLRVSSSSSTVSPTHTPNPSNPLSDSTRSISSILSLALVLSKLFTNTVKAILCKTQSICTAPTPEELVAIEKLRGSLVCTVGPLFFAALSDRPSGYLNTPLTVVASGMAKWLDIYSGVLMVRVLLSWFPNIPWDRQPLSAIRDLCDPYLNLFRNIIPPIFDTLDVSPLLAFSILGILGSILNNSRGTC